MVLTSRHGQAFARVLGFVTDESERVVQIYEHSSQTRTQADLHVTVLAIRDT